MKKQLVLFCILFLMACSPASSLVGTPTVTVVPMLEAVPTSTVVVTATAKPTVEATSTLPSIPERYDLPSWLNDSQATVAVMISDVDGQVYKLSMLNLATRESYEMSVSPDVVRGYFWTPDAKQFGFLAADLKSILLVNLATGKVEQQISSEKTTRFLDHEKARMIEPLIVQGVFESGHFFLIPPSSQSDFSANLKYRARENYVDASSPFLFVENLETGEVTQITDPLDGWYDYGGGSWSPNASYLAVVQSIELAPRMIPSGEKITIYKSNGEKVISFEGDFKSPVWSPDGSSILYGETSLPSLCILDIATGGKRCLREIERNHPDVQSIARAEWSQSGDKIYYIYYSRSNSARSGFCVYNLLSGVEFCPLIDGLDLEKKNVEWYRVSPDEQIFVVSVGLSCAGCDVWGEPSSIVISLDGKISYELAKEVVVTQPYTFAYPMGSWLWRP